MRSARVLLVALTALLGGCSVFVSGASTETVHGTATYHPRIALPPDAVLTVRLEDTSRADAPAREVARTVVPAAGRQVPLPFRLTYRASDAAPPAVLGLQAEIRDADGTLRWTTTQAYPLVAGRPPSRPYELVLEQVPASRSISPTPDLTGAEWRLVRLDAEGQMSRRPAEGEVYTLTFGTDGTVGGQADCNRLGGPYALDGRRLMMGPLATTLVACGPRSMDGIVTGLYQEPLEVRLDASDGLHLVAPSGQTLVFARVASPPTPAPAATLVYACPTESGAMRFTLRVGDGEAGIWLPDALGGRFAVLPQVPAASGVRYERGDLTVWIRGHDALLVVGERRFESCRHDAGTSVWEDARRRGITFRAVGQEPGWTFEIRRDGRLHFALAGREPVEHPLPDVALEGRSTVYHAEVPGGRLSATVTPGRCTDTMSGESFEASVTVAWGGTSYRGCGRAL